jgi:hypothetical protein
LTFRCRTKIPHVEADWADIETDSPEQAAMEFHAERDYNSVVYVRETENGGRERVLFALIEIEGHGERVSRVFHRAIWRKGGVRPTRPVTIEDVARKLGWTKDPQELLAEGWDLEEGWPACDR